ncbi:MAG TPA: penicillin acylase family protein, partial [Chloroflexota bacterium]|nr:penicillin acylase family protein [Chloroflexota bacterium]
MAHEQEILRALRGEITIGVLRAETGLSDADFQAGRAALLRRCLPPSDQTLRANTNARVEILRDGHGIPHIYAESTADAYFGLGFAMAEDRLWQMDAFRRRGKGTLAEVLGASYLASDITHRTIDLE